MLNTCLSLIPIDCFGSVEGTREVSSSIPPVVVSEMSILHCVHPVGRVMITAYTRGQQMNK